MSFSGAFFHAPQARMRRVISVFGMKMGPQLNRVDSAHAVPRFWSASGGMLGSAKASHVEFARGDGDETVAAVVGVFAKANRTINGRFQEHLARAEQGGPDAPAGGR